MTKVRAPLTFENALSQVAGVIGWAKTAHIVGQAERTVRNWSEPDTTAKISLEAALKLDVAFHEEGGEGAPFHDCYATRLDVETLAAVSGREALLAGVAIAAKESGEAVHAAIVAAHPNASHADVVLAEREIEEAIKAKTNVLGAIRAKALALLSRRSDAPRAPEVALSDTG